MNIADKYELDVKLAKALICGWCFRLPKDKAKLILGEMHDLEIIYLNGSKKLVLLRDNFY